MSANGEGPVKILNRWLCEFGLDLRKFLGSWGAVLYYVKDYRLFQKAVAAHPPRVTMPIKLSYPCLLDRFASSGGASGHYFHQDLYVAQKIFAHGPGVHVDVGSRVDGFVAHVAAFRQIEVFDIRPQEQKIANISFKQVDLMGALPAKYHKYADSLSCLHALEHFGLGRYGDTLNPKGHLLGLKNLHLILKEQGILYLSVPIGPMRIEFNAHRVLGLPYMLEIIRKEFAITSFSYVDDRGDFHEDVDFASPSATELVANHFGCQYGCGIFTCVKN